MADIFISYSSKDREKAEQLTELLISAGLSVWIDKHGIDAATSWSKEIVQAIDNCKALLVLLSPNSVVSINVAKEVSLAAEQKKKILPLDLEPVELTDDLRYHLAGIQRTSMTNIDAIIRALGKLGLEAAQAPTMQIVKETDGRKSLMILPFEDLSPTGDNGWFADGIANELIAALSHIKSLRVADQQATKDYKRYQGTLPVYAKEMSIRYFIQGDVRKFGDQIKISSSLLDIETGDHLWQDTLKGTMEDIFDIQEKVAEKVVEGLKVHLAPDEKKKLAERGTENAEAYELYMKASEYFGRHTKDGYELAVEMLTEAIKLDASFAQAHRCKASALLSLYRGYDRNPKLLDEAEVLCKEALRLDPDLFLVYFPLSHVYIHRGDLAKAEETAREYIRKAPQYFVSHFALGFLFMETGQAAKAIAPFEEALRLKPDDLASLWNIVSVSDGANQREKCTYWAEAALPHMERYLKLHPDEESRLVQHTVLLALSGRTSDAHLAAVKLTDFKDGASLYNTACLFVMLGDKPEAIRTFRKAIEAGFRDIRSLKEFLNNKKDGISEIAGTPEYEEVKRLVENIEREAEEKNTG